MAAKKTIVRSESLATDRVTGPIDDDIVTCSICMNVFWKPITCKNCENSFCLKCIRLWLNEKPNTCPFNCRFEQRNPPPILVKLLSKLKFHCQNEPIGCTLLIPYEALEKHELYECLFRLTQCPECSKEMLYNELEDHRNTDCLPKQLTCLKCDTTYYQKDDHTRMDCLKKLTQTLDDAKDKDGLKLSKGSKLWSRVSQCYQREQQNEDYARRMLAREESQDPTPSAPPYEPPTPDFPGSQASASGTASARPPKESLRLSTIDFSSIPNLKKEGGHLPNGYAAFDWENIYYMCKEHVQRNSHLNRFLNAYTGSSQCVAFNGKGKPIQMFLANRWHTFGLHSFEAMSIYHDDFELSVASYRDNAVVAVKKFTLTNKTPALFEINWQDFDKLVFTPSRVEFTSKPETFVLTCLNLIL